MTEQQRLESRVRAILARMRIEPTIPVALHFGEHWVVWEPKGEGRCKGRSEYVVCGHGFMGTWEYNQCHHPSHLDDLVEQIVDVLHWGE